LLWSNEILTTATEIWSLAEPYLAAEHLELDDLEVSGAGNGRRVVVVVDGDGLDVGRLAQVSRGLSRLLDNESDLNGSYQLEVSSPGLERKLRRPGHFVKSVGKEVRAKVKLDDRNRTLAGVITDASESGFTIDLGDETVTVPYDAVLKATTVFRWEKAPKPGH
jgi:ribosome maturation factor RimP